jgi:hypothetical protein
MIVNCKAALTTEILTVGVAISAFAQARLQGSIAADAAKTNCALVEREDESSDGQQSETEMKRHSSSKRLDAGFQS